MLQSEWSWIGPRWQIITISSDEFRRDSLELLVEQLEKLKNLREIFKNAQTLPI